MSKPVSALHLEMGISWTRQHSITMAILLASLAFVSSCREAGSASSSKDDGRARGGMAAREVSAEKSESGHPEWHYTVVRSKGEPAVELRFQIPEGTSPEKSVGTDAFYYVMMSPSGKVYRFTNAELFAKAAEYQKTRYHHLEDFEVTDKAEIPLFMQDQ
jgi:hypothetical protein